MNVNTEKFGTIDGQDIHLITIVNDHGMVLKLINYGATITDIQIPNGDNTESVVCGFDRLEDYLSDIYLDNAPYFGCTVGRYSSQIKDARFQMDGQLYKLNANCGANNLHGGTKGFDKHVWDYNIIEDKAEVAVEFRRTSPHMEEGFPGKVKVRVVISLTNDNQVRIFYSGNTDQNTPLSLTNHTYFNLSSFRDNVEDHEVKVHAGERLATDDSGACTGEILNVENTLEDLRLGRRVGNVHKGINDGFEHFYIFPKDIGMLKPVAEISHPASKRRLEVLSTEPCMLFYTAKYMSDQLQRSADYQFGKYRAFACETHRYPNGPNIDHSPRSITTPDSDFISSTVYKFSW